MFLPHTHECDICKKPVWCYDYSTGVGGPCLKSEEEYVICSICGAIADAEAKDEIAIADMEYSFMGGIM